MGNKSRIIKINKQGKAYKFSRRYRNGIEWGPVEINAVATVLYTVLKEMNLVLAKKFLN